MVDNSIKQLTIPKDSSWSRRDATYYFRQYVPLWLKEFLIGVKNIVRWIPILYKDRDWDHSFIFDILSFKLTNQRRYIVENNRSEGVSIDNRDITLCLNLIEKVKSEHYYMEYSEYHESDYNWLPVDNEPNLTQLDIVEKSERYDDYFIKNKNWYRKAVTYIKSNSSRYSQGDLASKDKSTIAMTIGRLKQDKANELLFRILEEKIGGWWD